MQDVTLVVVGRGPGRVSREVDVLAGSWWRLS